MPKTKNAGLFKWSSTFDGLLVEIKTRPFLQTWSEIARQLEIDIREACPNTLLTTFPNGKKCRERWVEHLDLSVSRDPFTHKEIDFIIKRRGEGVGFADIGRELGHCANQVKNLYYRKRHNKVDTLIAPEVFDTELPSPDIEVDTAVSSVSEDLGTPKHFSSNRYLSISGKILFWPFVFTSRSLFFTNVS